MPNKKITELPTAGALDGSELVEVVQGGANAKTTAQDIADLGGGGSVQSVTGDGVINVDPINPVINLTTSRTITSADDLDQSDNLHIVYADSATPFNITVDLLTTDSQVTVINKGAATATLIAGAGVTLAGGTIAIPSGKTALIIYKTPATPDVYTGSVSLSEITGLGTGVATALAVNVGSAGAVVVLNGAGGTPSAIVLTNATGLPLSAIVGLGTNVATWLGTPSWTNFLAAITGTAPFWSSASGVTLTGVNTITSNTANQLINTGTWTATANSQYHIKISPSITGRGTAGDYVSALEIDSAMTAGANTQTHSQLIIKGTYNTGAFTGMVARYILVRPTAGSNDVFSVGEGSLRIGNQGSTQNVTISCSGSDNTISATGGNGLKLQHATVISLGSSSLDSVFVRAPASFGVQILQAVITATTNAASQRNSGNLNITTKLWSGAAAFDDFFTTRATVSTAVDSEMFYDIFTGSSAGTPSLATLLFRLKNNGALLLGAGASTSLTPHSTLNVLGSFAPAYVAKSANYTATISDHTIECTSGTFQVTLPTAVGITGRIYYIVNSGAGTITVGTTSSQTFVNVTATPTTLTMATIGTVSVQSNGANWMKLSGL